MSSSSADFFASVTPTPSTTATRHGFSPAGDHQVGVAGHRSIPLPQPPLASIFGYSVERRGVLPHDWPMAETITIRTDAATEHALDVLTRGGISREAAIRQAVLEAAVRHERAAEARRAILRVPIGEPDGIDAAVS